MSKKPGCCCLPSEAPKPGVIIQGGKYDGERAVLQMKLKKTWRLRLLDKKRPLAQRFDLKTPRGKVTKLTAVRSNQIIVLLPSDRFRYTTEQALPEINTWSGEALRSARQYVGATRQQLSAADERAKRKRPP